MADPIAPDVVRGIADWLMDRYLERLRYDRARSPDTATDYDKLVCFSLAVRDLAAEGMVATEKAYTSCGPKRIYYLSMEFLMGRLLGNNILAFGLRQAADQALARLGLDWDRLWSEEPDAGLGNGGLGRLAACFLDSLATLGYAGYGCGLRYEHGMFRQEFDSGWQMERPDNWLKFGYPWEIVHPKDAVPVLLYGRIEYLGAESPKPVWIDWQMIEGVPYDIPVIGFGGATVNSLRLWSSRASESFRLDVFNRGDYVKAVEEKNWAENICKVVYPSENTYAGKELRLIQEYFLVACSVRDAIRRHRTEFGSLDNFAEKNALQINDTHPSLAVAELMRHFLDEHDWTWEKAWETTVASLGYTNHTLLPEALEKWPVPLLEKVLPRHLQIIYEINKRLLEDVSRRYPGDVDRTRRMSLIEESDVKQVRMAHLAIVGSHAVNGVARLHTELLKSAVVPDFAEMFPERFSNKTNGVTPRRWLLACNPGLAALISEAIGDRWIRDLDELRGLEPLAEDAAFRDRFLAVKDANKRILAALIADKLGGMVDAGSIFDVQIKRLHEYKRQLLNALHIIALYHRIKDDPSRDIVPRTFVFGAKAAPGYLRAKLIIKFINTLGRILSRDSDVAGRLRVAFLPDYCVSLAEVIVPAADLSEQISMAGKEASGTGNMKLALNGALTIGTWDGANIEITEAVGPDNIFIFGHRAEDFERMRREDSYRPSEWLAGDEELNDVIQAIGDGAFDDGEPGIFEELYRSLTEWGDPYFHLADFRGYIEAQEKAAALFRNRSEWARKAVLNVSRMGFFSSDRAIREYARDIWGASPCPRNGCSGS